MNDYDIAELTPEDAAYRRLRDGQQARYQRLRRQRRCICCAKRRTPAEPYVRCNACHTAFRTHRQNRRTQQEPAQ